MPELTFVTGNPEKFAIGEQFFATQGIRLLQATYDIDEIQGTDPDKIILDKVNKAFALVKQPVVVNDDCWAFMGLGGFPGPYMKDVCGWFTAQDFINLTSSLTDRRVILSQRIAYQDAATQKIFTLHYEGEILPEVRGSYGNSLQKIITMPGDEGKSVSEAYDAGSDTSQREVNEGWKEFMNWYKDYAA